jgi:pimeloyl-ACP methyl ester carboxylesterase
MGLQIETIRTDGFSMDYFRFGHGEKTLVILPGLSVDSVMKYAGAVSKAYGLLADDFTVCLFDRRKELPEAYSVYEMAEDTAAAIRALGPDSVCLFGASQGGMIAMAIAARYPEMVSRLVLGSTSACVEQEQYQTIENWIRLAKAGDAKGLYLAFGEAIYPPEVFERLRDLLAAASAGVTDQDLQRFVILAEGIKGFDLTDRLYGITCPVLVIGSMDDGVLGADASEQIAAHLKGHTDCELYMYHGYGHAVYDLAPDYKERLLKFLTA